MLSLVLFYSSLLRLSASFPIFLLLPSLLLPKNSGFPKFFLRADVGKNAAQRGSLPGQLAHLFVKVCEEAVYAGNATVKGAGAPGKTSFRCKVHILALSCTGKSDHTAIHAANTQNQCKTDPYSYTLARNDEVPKKPGEPFISILYACDSDAMRAMSTSASPRKTSSFGLHCSSVGDVESSPDDVIDVSIDDDTARKEVSVRHFDPQTRSRRKLRTSILKVDEIQNPLRAIL